MGGRSSSVELLLATARYFSASGSPAFRLLTVIPSLPVAIHQEERGETPSTLALSDMYECSALVALVQPAGIQQGMQLFGG